MRQYDFSPLYRSTIGFDRLFNILDQLSGVDAGNSYPPYNIERTGENAYRITIALAGFGEKDLAIEVKEGLLTVRGDRKETTEATDGQTSGRQVLYRGIAGRSFERTFQLADHVEVRGAQLENGLLHVDLVREIPEALKPRKIEITAAGKGRAKVAQIDTTANAA